MKIKEEQLNKIKDQQQGIANIIHKIGVLESKKHAALHEMAVMNQDVEDYKKVLEEEYGQVNINLEDGSYEDIKPDEI
tara:strand:+ start:114 stop:347 length:234 start_codon:yes stop_codon:yes gene_type:complete